MEHDFGVVAPRTKLTHTFLVRNDTERQWVLKSVERSCSCTVARASSETIQAGSEESFEFIYNTGGRLGVKGQSATLLFAEPGSPGVTLRVRAKVCLPMTPVPEELHFGVVGRGREAVETIRLENYSETDWHEVLVGKTPEWVLVDRAVRLPIAGRGMEQSPRQVWAVTARIAASRLESEFHRGEIALTAGGGASCSVPISIRVASAVSASPALVMFGRVSAGTVIKRNVVVGFAEEPGAWTPTDVAVRNRTGQLIELGWRVLSKKRWLLTVELSAGAGRAADQIVKGELVLGFPGQDLQPLPIPVHAIIVGLKR